ncbi:MAG: pilus assembly protein CpaC [Desulforhopalus sp.]|jgi:pilus assembly protein CpaC
MKAYKNIKRSVSGGVLLLLPLYFLMSGHAFAAKQVSDVVVVTDAGQTINLVVGKLGKLKSSKMVKKYHVVDPKVIELMVPDETDSKYWVFFSAKASGTTQLTLWGEDNNILSIFNIVVSPDIDELKKKLHEIFPDENVQVRSSGDYITLNGTVTSPSRMTKVVALAQTYSSSPGKVLNMLKIGGIQQVMLEVKVAEVSRNVGKQLGINFAATSADGKNTVASLVGNLIGTSITGAPTLTGGLSAFLGFSGSGGDLTVIINALEEDGLIKILAEPTLIALNGQQASFLAGGEFPIPKDSGDGKTSIEWKDFGVSLNFTPTVLGDGNLSMRVNPEISELDFSNATIQNGFVVPGLETRRMSTVVEVKDGQSFAIAGLLKSVVRENITKLPILGSIPILGALFRSTEYQKNETELVVIVTPHLVKPLDMANQPLPTDSFIDPDAFELLLLGMLEGRPGKHGVPKGSETASGHATTGLEGDFGYIIPE